jgi:ribose 5-phosphate isomerase RpiB
MPFHNLLLLSRPTDDNYLNSTIRKIVSHGISYSKIEYQESDYIKAIFNITELVTLGKADGAIILSKTGIEASIIANKFPNICASRCASSTMGMYTRAHNMSNILCLGTEMQGEITVSDSR